MKLEQLRLPGPAVMTAQREPHSVALDADLTVPGDQRSAGLTPAQALERLLAVGPNEIAQQPPTSGWIVFGRQFASPVIGLLLVAGAVMATIGERLDAVAIGAIVLVNAVIGFLQEHRAERAILALRAMTAPRARVRRDGHDVMVPARAVVPGDLLILEAGDLVAADARLVTARALRANEATLTGESAPVDKHAGGGSDDAPHRDEHVYMGTSIAAGTGSACVVATGMSTEFGRIAHLLATAESPETPLQRRMARVSRMLLWICGAIVVVVTLAGLLRGLPTTEVLLGAVALAVAAVPEGLPAIVTIALALGIQRMAARHVLVRRMPAVEALGCATVICTDKTGTLTSGVMRVRELWGRDHAQLLFAGAACSDAELAADGPGGIGDPTELAILMAAAEHGIRRQDIEATNPRISEAPFDPASKRMSVARADRFVYTKGAAESVLPLCVDGTSGALDATLRMAERGLRVIAVAIARAAEPTRATFVGLIGISDPPRPEAIAAVTAARTAGITTVMITGDHPATAWAIAREMGIASQAADVERVHARATPEDKLRVVRDWKARGAVVAMTGDGVNDAPALREAHIGIAMGRTGTEVTREASDIVLTDDNFASIVAAIYEGRAIFDNIRKALVYLLAGNTAELAVVLIAVVSGLPLPLIPLQLLWINVVTDGLPALALVVDPPDDDVSRRPPRDPGDPMLGAPQWQVVVGTGILQAVTTLAVFLWALKTRGLADARDFAFTVLVFGELFRSFGARSTTRLFWQVGPLTNRRLLAVVACSIALQVGLHYVPATRAVFEIGPMSARDLAISLLVSLVPISAIELSKPRVGKHAVRPGESSAP